MIKILGGMILLVVFTILFLGMALSIGMKGSLIVWGSAIIFTGLIWLGLNLLVG